MVHLAVVHLAVVHLAVVHLAVVHVAVAREPGAHLVTITFASRSPLSGVVGQLSPYFVEPGTGLSRVRDRHPRTRPW